MNKDPRYSALSSAVSGMYDLQKLRIQTGNRLVAELHARAGREPGQKTEELSDKDASMLLKQAIEDYELLISRLEGKQPRAKRFKPEGIISNYAISSLCELYRNLEESEKAAVNSIKQLVHTHPLWDGFLKEVKGCGEGLAAVIISRIDIASARYPSSLWRYAGYDVADDGRGRSRRKEHLEERQYIDKTGEEKTKLSITFNPFLKTKLFLLGESFVKQKDGHYRQLYDNYKHRLENHKVYGIANEEARIAEFKEKGMGYAPKAHRHRMAIRYVIKIFLIDLHVAWRRIEGLPVAEPYHVAKLGMRAH